MENKMMYIVRVCEGSYEDYYEHEKFVTADRLLAEGWVKQYNRLVDQYGLFVESKRDILGYIENDVWDKRHSDLVYDCPRASYIEVEVRV